MTTREGFHRWALVPLRFMIGFGFAAHGYAKLARGPGGFAAILDTMGVPAPHAMAWVTSLVECAGGIAVMLGAWVALVALPLAAIMLTAMFGVHLRYGFSSVRLMGLSSAGATFGPVGYELNLVYVAGLIALALGGAGPLSVDGWLERRRAHRR